MESATYGKHGDSSLNEDGLFVGDAFVAVVDGVTSKCRLVRWNPSPGVIARESLLETLAVADVEHPDMDVHTMQRLLDSSLRGRYDDVPDHPRDFFDVHPEERLAANAVVFSAARREIWLFGDCQAMVNGTIVPTTKRVDVVLAAVRSMVCRLYDMADADGRRMISEELGSGLNGGLNGGSAAERGIAAFPADDERDIGREAISPLLRLQSRFANRRDDAFGYFVFDGYTDREWPVPVIPVNSSDEIILASDGYPILKRSLEESERALSQLRDRDPRLIREFESTKGFPNGSGFFDDRTYIRFVV
ncbi:hypothetical protein Uis1B_1848 [Bifidobacterium margollesii]|uniref:PPM-type phosphatase domain-containing protein n=1 Tax=Bifidobacterium margollesii TaxID=2020964 RepID=A0A2N5J845_9BIFI|nr:hypothetical protein [Bifidobacterium margollesii]PLS30361.1 hypothetical protein Uis1B_1848 [Bifidobacterium margollesii]